MKIVLKILCLPVIAVLAVFIWISVQIVKVSAVVLNVIAIFVALGALCVMYNGSTVQGIIALMMAALLSPVGLPLLSIMLLGQIQRFRYWMQDSVY